MNAEPITIFVRDMHMCVWPYSKKDYQLR